MQDKLKQVLYVVQIGLPSIINLLRIEEELGTNAEFANIKI